MTDTATAVDVKLERAYDRADLASVFRAFATALEDGTPVQIEGDDATATVTVPPRVAVELEAEREVDDEPPVAGLAVDLEWDDPDGSSIRLDADEDRSVVIASSIEQGADSTTDPAMATMPPDGVPGNRDQERSERADAASSDDSESGSESTEQSTPSSRTSRFEVYQDRADEWRWRLVHWNGNIVADSGEGYASRSNAKRAARGVMRTAPTATIVNRDSGAEGDRTDDAE